MSEVRTAQEILERFIGNLAVQFAAVQAELERVRAERDVANAALERVVVKDEGHG